MEVLCQALGELSNFRHYTGHLVTRAELLFGANTD